MEIIKKIIVFTVRLFTLPIPAIMVFLSLLAILDFNYRDTEYDTNITVNPNAWLITYIITLVLYLIPTSVLIFFRRHLVPKKKKDFKYYEDMNKRYQKKLREEKERLVNFILYIVITIKTVFTIIWSIIGLCMTYLYLEDSEAPGGFILIISYIELISGLLYVIISITLFVSLAFKN